jgi:hypothetical protein
VREVKTTCVLKASQNLSLAHEFLVTVIACLLLVVKMRVELRKSETRGFGKGFGNNELEDLHCVFIHCESLHVTLNYVSDDI